jgi:hypothetical protein
MVAVELSINVVDSVGRSELASIALSEERLSDDVNLRKHRRLYDGDHAATLLDRTGFNFR